MEGVADRFPLVWAGTLETWVPRVLIWQIIEVSLATVLSWWHASRARGKVRPFKTCAIYLSLFVLSTWAVRPTISWRVTIWLFGSIVGAVCLGGCLAVVTGYSRRLPVELRNTIDKAEAVLDEVRAASAERIETVERLSHLAHALIHAAAEVRVRLCVFSQGMGAGAWDQLQAIEVEFESRALDFMRFATNQMQAAESGAGADLWWQRRDEVHRLTRLVNDTLVALSGRIAYYQQQTMVGVAVAALLVSMIAAILQALSVPSSPSAK